MKLLFPLLTLLISLIPGASAETRVSFDQKGELPALVDSLKTSGKTSGPAVPRSPEAAVKPGFCVFNGVSGAPLAGETAFKAVLRDADAVFSGESHDQLKDHLAQLEALKALSEARGEKVVVGFEMLNMTLQPILDEYASGKLSEEEFLLKADWKTEWGFDFNLYKPIFDFIRANKLKALALNLPKKVVSTIARVGLEGLSPEQKKYLPAKVGITTNEAYIKYIRQSFEGHGKARSRSSAAAEQAFLRQYILGNEKSVMSGMFTFENYLAAMCAWNEAMGSRLADFLNANPGFSGQVIAGSGHVIYNAGIPASVASRTSGLRPVSFYPQEASSCPSAFPAGDAGLGDYVWYLDHAARSKK